jgi:nucleotide-binding universal stress UspA family protein
MVEKSFDEKSFKRIIVPVDGSKLSKKAAKVGCFLAERTKKKLILLHVNEIPATVLPPGQETYMPNLDEIIEKDGRKILKSIKGECDNKSITIKTEMTKGIPYREIIHFANDNDLIIMGSKGHSTFERVLIGSVSEKVLHHSECSVMIIR